MSPEPDRLGDEDQKSHVPCVTSVSVGTKPVDIRPSAYVGFPEGLWEMNSCINPFTPKRIQIQS